MNPKSLYEFGPFRLDVALNRLERGGAAILLPPKAFDLLVLLAANTGRVMGKTELIDALWPQTFVEEANLTQHVYTLRKALGDQPDGQPYIETVPRRGYRLAAAVVELTGERDRPARPAVADASAIVLGDERKFAAVLHCAVADAADIVERIGSAEMHGVMQRVLEIGEEEISRHEGAISRQHRDGFVAVFGADTVHEDDGRRATLAALAIRQRVSALGVAAGSDDHPLDLRIGIHVGALVVSRAAGARSPEFSAVGEAVRAADLLHQFASPGAILISESVRRTVERDVATEEVSPSPPGQRAYRVTGALTKSAAAGRPMHALAPFIGRQQEMALLERLGEQALRVGGQGQVVGIVGEPGMGKSRLVHEFMRPFDRQAAGVVTLEGRCVSYGSLVPYLPLVDLLRAHCAVDETDPPETVRTAIDEAVRVNGLPADAAPWLLRLLGIAGRTSAVETVSPEAIKERTFDALRLLLFKAAARRPLVVLVEDLHWIDRTSEEFLATVVDRLVGARVVLVVTHRPGYRAAWLDRSYVTQITLAPLAAEASAELVRSIASRDQLGIEASRAILDRGEGNPFFLEELARAVVEHGSGNDGIPATVQGVIMARIDRLPEASKQVLQTAAVLGREVPVRLLERLSDGRDVSAPLLDLCRQEFLYERAGGDEPIYVFKHALTQDVAYDSLLSRRRRALHLDAARALEELYGDRLEEMTATLAYHYARTDCVAESVTWLVRAADRAARAYANAEALLHLDLAARRLQRLPEGPGRDRLMVDVALRHAHSLYFLGRFRESVEVLLPHDARLARLDEPAVTGPYSFWLAHMYSRLGDQPRAAAAARRAIEAATAAGDEATLGKAHGVLALEGHWAGQPGGGIAHGNLAITILSARPDQRWWLGMAHFYLAMNHLLLGDFDEALAETSRADCVGREMGDPRLRTYAGFTAAWTEASRGNTEIAIARGRESLALAPDRVSRAYARLFLAFALLMHGTHDEASDLLGALVSELEGFAFPHWQALATTWAAEALRRQGRLDEAMDLATRGLAVATSAGYGYAIGFAHRTSGRIARDRGLAEEAAAMFADAVRTFTRIGAVFEAARQP